MSGRRGKYANKANPSDCVTCEHAESDHDFGAFRCVVADCPCERFNKGRTSRTIERLERGVYLKQDPRRPKQ